MKNVQPKVAVVNPLAASDWNQQLLSCHDPTVFHTANWARLIAESYGYNPTYFTLSERGTLRGCLPVMEIDSLITGRRGVCLSFSDYCGALLKEPEDFRPLFDSIIERGGTSGWRYVEFRGEQLLNSEQPAKVYSHHLLELTPNETELYSRLRESTARNIRKSQKEGVTVEISRTLQGVRDFYRLHCLTRKRHGVPPQSIRFFEKLHEHLIAQGLGFTALARQGKATLAGVVCLHFGSNALYKYGASDERYQHLRPNNLVLWEAIRKCARDGFRTFSLGRTDLDNQGLLSFKNGWGGRMSDLNYYRYDFASSGFVRGSGRDMGIYKNMMRKLPVNVLRVLGKLAYRHMG